MPEFLQKTEYVELQEQTGSLIFLCVMLVQYNCECKFFFELLAPFKNLTGEKNKQQKIFILKDYFHYVKK